MAGGGLSSDPEKRARQLANLVDAPPAPPGNGRALVHGGTATVAIPGLDDARREILAAFSDAAPVKEGGAVPLADVAALELAARAFARARSADAWVAEHGLIDEATKQVHEAAKYAERATKTANALLKELGMTPSSRMKLFGNAFRAAGAGRDLAKEWSGDGGGKGS
jgi:P27 family predicted phage terminase small subunit